MKKLIYFSEKFDIKKYDNQPIPIDIYNSTGAILAHKDQKLSLKRLQNAYIYEDDISNIDVSDIEIPQGDSINDLDLESTAIEPPTNENTKKSNFTLSNVYEEESAEIIEKRLEKN